MSITIYGRLWLFYGVGQSVYWTIMMITTSKFSVMEKCKIFLIAVVIAGTGLALSSCRKEEPSGAGVEAGTVVSGDTNAGDVSPGKMDGETKEKVEEKGQNQNSEPVQARLADAMVKGVRYHGVSIKADKFDPASGMIYGVRVTVKGYLLSADRAEIKVNYADETARLILYNAVSVTVPTISEEKFTGNDEGEMTTYKRLELEPFSIKD